MLWLVILSVTAINTLIGLAVWFGHMHFWRWRLSTTPKYESVETLRMPDGGLIELRRVNAPHADDDRERDRVPILMIHGLAMNHRNHDTHEDYSFARYMHRQGRDVWLLTLRSGRRSVAPFSAANTDFASMVKHDLPGAVAAVLARTRQRQVDLSVFSMGGMLLYAGLERTLEARFVRRVAVFASPAQVRPLGVLSFVSFLPAALTPSSHLRHYIGTMAFAPRLVPSFVWRRLYNPDNVDRKIERGMLCDVWETIPGRLGADFLRWGANGGTLTVDGMPVLNGLSRVNVPACFFAGTVDWLAPAHTVRAGFDAWGRDVPGVEKQFVMLGRAHGTRNDYGHCDIAFGRHVHDEVFAPAARFLNQGVLPELALAAPAAEFASEHDDESYGVASPAE